MADKAKKDAKKATEKRQQEVKEKLKARATLLKQQRKEAKKAERLGVLVSKVPKTKVKQSTVAAPKRTCSILWKRGTGVSSFFLFL